MSGQAHRGEFPDGTSLQEYSEQGRAANAALVMTADEIKRLLAMAGLSRRGRAARATHALQERWLCPGRRPGAPMTARQSWRLFHETTEAAGIKKPVTMRMSRH